MTIYREITGNQVLMSGVIGWVVAQVLKTIIDIALNKSFNPERLTGSGGMPSSHSAFVCSCAASVDAQLPFLHRMRSDYGLRLLLWLWKLRICYQLPFCHGGNVRCNRCPPGDRQAGEGAEPSPVRESPEAGYGGTAGTAEGVCRPYSSAGICRGSAGNWNRCIYEWILLGQERLPAKKSARLSMSLHSRVIGTCFFNALSVSFRHAASDRIRPLHLDVKLFVCKING